MNMKKGVPGKGERILMITPDIMIDRRILIEAETLIENGYEVYLLAGWDQTQSSLFEIDGSVKIERIKFEGLDSRLKPAYKIQSRSISHLNNYLILINDFSKSLSAIGNKFINKSVETKNIFLNSISIKVQKKIESLALRFMAFRMIYNFLVFCLRVFLKIINYSSRLSNKVLIFGLKCYQFIIIIFDKSNNYIIGFIAKTINFAVGVMAKLFPFIIGFSAYETEYFKRALFYRPDIIHVHDLPMLRIGVQVKKKLRIPLIYDMHEFYPEQDVFNVRQRNKLRRIERKNIHYCNIRITVNPLLAKEISHTYDNIKIDVIQNAMILPVDFHNRKYNRFREEYSISEDEIILLYQGWISPHRNLQKVVTALSRVNKPIKFVIMGYGDFKTELKKIANEQGVTNMIIFVPSKSQKELLSYTASADLGIIPYPYKLDPNTMYASPNKLYEFIAARLPILCNSLPFVSSIVMDNGFGMAIDMDSPESFADALNNFSYEKIIIYKNNLAKYGKAFLWDVEATKLLNLYSSINYETDN